jgi:hypothetical protein
MRFSTSGFFHGSVFPKPLSIPLGPFQMFKKFSEIFAAQGSPPVLSTSVANGKSSTIKVLIFLFGHLREEELTYRYIFAFKFTLRSQQPDIVHIICHRCR